MGAIGFDGDAGWLGLQAGDLWDLVKNLGKHIIANDYDYALAA